MTAIVQEVGIPDSKLARAITELVRTRNHRCFFTIPAASITGARWPESGVA